MPAPRVNGWTVAYTAIGGVILWSGVKGTTLSTTARDLLKGQAPTQNEEPISGGETTSTGSSSPGGATPPPGDTGAGSAQAAANQAIAKLLAAPYGWSTGTEWQDLVSLWNQESSWSSTAVNPASGATGIPQLNPADYAIPPGWTSPSVQIAWGLNYIKTRYGSPSVAWAHEVSAGWY